MRLAEDVVVAEDAGEEQREVAFCEGYDVAEGGMEFRGEGVDRAWGEGA